MGTTNIHNDRSATRRSTIEPASLNYEKTVLEDERDEPRRRSFRYHIINNLEDHQKQEKFDEIDETERMITLTLQKIDRDLSRCGKTLSQRTIPALEDYNKHCTQVFLNVNHLKEFFENAINTTILTGASTTKLRPKALKKNGKGFQALSGELNDTKDDNVAFNDSKLHSSTQFGKTLHTRSRAELHSSLGPEQTAKKTVTDTASYIEPPKEIQQLLGTSQVSKSRQLPVKGSNLSTEILLEGCNKGYKQHKCPMVPQTPKSDTNRFSKVAKKYESPPWEEPPELESEKMDSSSHKKRHISPVYPDGNVSYVKESSFALDYSRATKGTNSEKRENTTNGQRAVNMSPWDSSSFDEPPELLTGTVFKRNTNNGEFEDVKHGGVENGAPNENLNSDDKKFKGLNENDSDEFQNPPSLLTEKFNNETKENNTNSLDSSEIYNS